ncbi:MAG: ABC transporter substrate-binding protein [Bacteroidia bacterium]|nr:ABC transporter substrate-binding protein [Bacteroidia bacterium]
MYKRIVYLLTILLLTSCGQGPSAEKMAAVFTMNLPKGCSTLDPAYARDQAIIWMTSQLFNGLVDLDEELKIKPALARSWDISEDGLTYTFHLRQGVQFHPDDCFGENQTRLLTSADVKYSFTRILDPLTASSGPWIFNKKVAGIDEYREGSSPEISGFQAPDDSTFQIQLISPFPPFLSLLAMPYAYVVPKEAVEKYGKDFRSHPVGTGPFRFKSWDEGSSLILLKNEHYFESGARGKLPYLEAVQVKFIESELSAFIEFTQGRLDFINGLDASFKDEVMEAGGEIKPDYRDKYQFAAFPQLNTEFIAILVDPEMEAAQGHPLLDKRVRQALNYAIDREKLVKYLLNGNGYPANAGLVPMGMPGFNPEMVKGYAFDPDKAAQLLAEAGYPGGKGLPALSLKSNPKYQAVMEFVQKSMESIGVTLEIDNMQGATLRELSSKGQINLWRASWIADYPDAENYLSLCYSGYFPPDGANRMRYKNARFDSLYEATLTLTQDSARLANYNQMEDIMMADAPVIPLYYDKIFRVIQPNVQGMKTNAMNLLYLKEVWKE